MRKHVGSILILVVCVAFGIVAVWSLAGTRFSGPARVAVDRDAHNWGRVLPGAEVETSFTIRNLGGLPLHLGEIKKSCGCTNPRLDQDIVPPGGRTTLAVGFHASTNLGAARNFVTIKTDDPEKPMLELNLFAESWLGVTAVPQAIDAGPVRPGDVLRRDVQVRSPDGKPFRIGRASADIAELSVEVEDAAEPLAVHRAVVVYRAGDRLGEVSGAARFATDREDAPFVDVGFTARVAGPVAASPATIEIDREEIGQVVRRKFVLRSNRPGRALALKGIEAIPPWELRTRESQTLSDGSLIVDVTFRFPTGAGDPSGNLDLSVEAPEEVRLRIPLTIRGWTAPPPAS